MPVVYEWWAGEIDAHGDCLELHFFNNRADAEQHTAISDDAVKVDVELVRSVIEDGDLMDRQYARIVNGVLPTEFNGGATVPKRFNPGCKRKEEACP
jgi:hypothetical protein